MSSEREEFDGRLIEEYLRYLRGRGPRPQTEGLPEGERRSHEDLFRLLEAIVDAEAIEMPPLEEDSVARRLGLRGERPGTPDEPESGEGQAPGVPAAIASSLDEVVHQLNGEADVFPLGNGEVARSPNGLRPLAECRSLGEMILVCDTQRADFSDIPAAVAHMFADNPMFTAIAVVSSLTNQAVVLTHADCVRAIDPRRGWVEPALPAPPEPVELALGRYLARSLPRWDEVARLDDLLLLAEAHQDISATVGDSLTTVLERKPKIAAKKKALTGLMGLSQEPFESLVEDIRKGRLGGEVLIQRLREISGAEDS